MAKATHNDVDEFGLDPVARKRLRVKEKMQRGKKPEAPFSSRAPFGFGRVANLPGGSATEEKPMRLRHREYLSEKQRAPIAGGTGGEGEFRLGAFKVSSALLKMAKDMGLDSPAEILFKQQREYIDSLSQEELARMFKQDGIAYAQDVIAKAPRQAFQTWLSNVAKVDPKLGRWVRAVPGNAPLYFYAIVWRVSGRDMADLIFKRYFHSTPEQAWRGEIKKRMGDKDIAEETSSLRRRSLMFEGASESMDESSERTGPIKSTQGVKVGDVIFSYGAHQWVKVRKVNPKSITYVGTVAPHKSSQEKFFFHDDKVLMYPGWDNYLNYSSHNTREDAMQIRESMDEASGSSLLSDKAYDTRIKVPKISVAIDVGGAIRFGKEAVFLRKVFPEHTKSQHGQIAAEAKAIEAKLQKQYETELEKAAQETWGRPVRVTDYKISCIYSDEFSDKRKNVLRKLCRDIQRAKDIGRLHSAGTKLRGAKEESMKSMNVEGRMPLTEGMSQTRAAIEEAVWKKVPWTSKGVLPDSRRAVTMFDPPSGKMVVRVLSDLSDATLRGML